MLRAGMGFEAAMVEGADRESKDRLGVFAYAFSALQALANPTIARYHLTVDGLQVQTEGLTCIIANSGSMGRPGIVLSPQINVSDGLLDAVVVTRTDLPSLVALAASVLGKSENPPALQLWQAREITVVAEPPQTVQVDGEIVGETPVTARVIPQAVRVLVPPPAGTEAAA
jgi:diacylglycerol kinase family enzyme